VIPEVRTLGICAISLYWNSFHRFKSVKEIVSDYEHCLGSKKFTIDGYHCRVPNLVYCEHVANPQKCKIHDHAYRVEATFVGYRDGDRTIHKRSSLDGVIDVYVWGLSCESGNSRTISRLR